MIEEKVIEIAPLAFMRGRTLANAFCVLDEAQNATTMQMKMFLTRLARGSRMVITGDRTQVDQPRGHRQRAGRAERLLKGIRKISFNYFTSRDVVAAPVLSRPSSRLTTRIVKPERAALMVVDCLTEDHRWEALSLEALADRARQRRAGTAGAGAVGL